MGIVISVLLRVGLYALVGFIIGKVVMFIAQCAYESKADEENIEEGKDENKDK